MPEATNPQSVIRTRGYLGLLVIAALLGAPISAGAYWYLKLSTLAQNWVFTDLPRHAGFSAEPSWWPFIPLAVCGPAVAAVIRYLPGRGGHSPAEGFHTTGVAAPADLPGIAAAGLIGLALGAVVGPEAPLIALGGGCAALAVRLAKRDVPERTGAVVASVGSFAAISTVLGSPLTGAFLLMEASGLGGATATAMLTPGLLGAGIGSLVFTGLNSLTGYGTFSLALPSLPPFTRPDGAEIGWALVIGLAAAVLGTATRRLALLLRPMTEGRLLPTTAVGLAIAGLAFIYTEAVGKPTADVLFSGQDTLGPLVARSAQYSAGALVLLIACKGLAYAVSIAALRGGPTFPAVFIGGAGGLAMSHLPGLPLVAGLAAGMAAMTAVMLKLPMTSVLLATLLLGGDSIAAMPLVIVSVVAAYVASVWLEAPAPASAPTPPAT